MAGSVRTRVRPRVRLSDRDARRGRVDGVLPLVFIKSPLFGRSMTSLPFVNYGGVLADSERRGARAARARRRTSAQRARRARMSSCAIPTTSFEDLPCKQHKVSMRLAARARDVGAASIARSATRFARRRSRDLTVERGGAELVPRLLHGVRPQHARSGHAGLRAPAVRRSRCAHCPIGPACWSFD